MGGIYGKGNEVGSWSWSEPCVVGFFPSQLNGKGVD